MIWVHKIINIIVGGWFSGRGVLWVCSFISCHTVVSAAAYIGIIQWNLHATLRNHTKMGFNGPSIERFWKANLWPPALTRDSSSHPPGSSACHWSFVKLLILIWLPANLGSADYTLLGWRQTRFQQLYMTTNGRIVAGSIGMIISLIQASDRKKEDLNGFKFFMYWRAETNK